MYYAVGMEIRYSGEELNEDGPDFAFGKESVGVQVGLDEGM